MCTVTPIWGVRPNSSLRFYCASSKRGRAETIRQLFRRFVCFFHSKWPLNFDCFLSWFVKVKRSLAAEGGSQRCPPPDSDLSAGLQDADFRRWETETEDWLPGFGGSSSLNPPIRANTRWSPSDWTAFSTPIWCNYLVSAKASLCNSWTDVSVESGLRDWHDFRPQPS